MNWIKLLGIGKYILLSIFIIIVAIKRLHLIENHHMIKKIWIFDLDALVILLYFMVYLMHKWLVVKTKRIEI